MAGAYGWRPCHFQPRGTLETYLGLYRDSFTFFVQLCAHVGIVVVSFGAKQPGCEADYSVHCNVEGKNKWRSISIPIYVYGSHRDNSALLYLTPFVVIQ